MLVAVGFGALTWRQEQGWHDRRSLWTHALSTTPSAIAHHNLGVFILGRGERATAVGHFRLAVAIKPD